MKQPQFILLLVLLCVLGLAWKQWVATWEAEARRRTSSLVTVTARFCYWKGKLPDPEAAKIVPAYIRLLNELIVDTNKHMRFIPPNAESKAFDSAVKGAQCELDSMEIGPIN